MFLLFRTRPAGFGCDLKSLIGLDAIAAEVAMGTRMSGAQMHPRSILNDLARGGR
jgi:hypothetical protein